LSIALRDVVVDGDQGLLLRSLYFAPFFGLENMEDLSGEFSLTDIGLSRDVVFLLDFLSINSIHQPQS